MIAARRNGVTAGVTRQGTQVVFTSSAAPAKARGATKPSSKAPAAAVTAPQSTRTVTDDLWADVAGAGTSPIAAAEAAAGGGSRGLGAGVVVGVALLGIGIAGLTGAILTTGRRRTAKRDTR